MKTSKPLTRAEVGAERRFFRALAEIPDKAARQRIRDALLRDRKLSKSERIEKLEDLVSSLENRVAELESGRT